MRRQAKSLRCFVLHAALLCCAALGALSIGGLRQSQAATTFTIDPNQSFVTLTAEVPGVGPMLEQLPGSLTTNFMGTIEVELGVPGQIAFPGGGVADFLAHPGSFLPGGSPADFAGRIENVPPSGDTAFVTLRGVSFDTTGAAVPLSAGGDFSADGLVFDILGGIGEVQLGPTLVSALLGGGFLVNDTAVPGSLETIGGDFFLVIPIAATTSIPGTPAGTIEMAISGQLVAVAPVPEPSTFILLAIGIAAFITVCRRTGAA